MNQNDILSYVSTFITFLIKNIDIKKIDKIILFGSAVTGNITKESDLDLFIDTKENLNKKIKDISERFYKSKEFMLFKLRKIENRFSIKVGELRKWRDLHRTITSNGVVLYSKYEPSELPIGTKHKVIFYWNKVGRNRGAFLNKVYGYIIKEKRYSGLLEKWGGKRLGKSCIIIPFERIEEMISLLKEYKVDVKSVELFSLE